MLSGVSKAMTRPLSRNSEAVAMSCFGFLQIVRAERIVFPSSLTRWFSDYHFRNSSADVGSRPESWLVEYL